MNAAANLARSQRILYLIMRTPMGFQFAGLFAQGERTLLDAALDRWPGCHGRLITEPFHGIGIVVPSRILAYGDTDEEEQARELAYALENELVDWSKHYPNVQFVFINADYFGGTCFYSGYVCQNGMTLDRVKNASRSDDGLPRLVRVLGVK